MKVEKTMQISIEHGEHSAEWDSRDPNSFALVISDERDTQFTLNVDRKCLVDLRAMFERVMKESDKAKPTVTPTKGSVR